MKRFDSFLCLIFTGVLVLGGSGCPGGDSDDSSATSPPETAGPTPSAEMTLTPTQTPRPGTPTPVLPGPTSEPPTPVASTPEPPTPTPPLPGPPFGLPTPTPTAPPPTPTETPPTPTPDPASLDLDLDSFPVTAGDCNDHDASIYPGADEVPYDGIDQDCDGADLTDVDQDDHDAIIAGGDDCDDQDASTYPGAQEFADEKDNDCDGSVDENLSTTDDDLDGFPESEGDCNDYDATVYPDADEVPYDGIDQDCDGADLTDVDQDGYPGGPDGSDCNDTDATIHPGVPEVCDGVDNDCDNVIDLDAIDRMTYYLDADGDGYGDAGSPVLACALPGGAVENQDDCDDSSAEVHPGAEEVCNEYDDDCDGAVDEGVTNTYYLDADGDGYGTSESTTEQCALPAGYSTFSTDCDDTDATVNPGATESCDGVDNDCDILEDEGCPNSLACSGAGLIHVIPDECMNDGGGSGVGDSLEVYCFNHVARFCLSGEYCQWRSGFPSTDDGTTCERSGLGSDYMANAWCEYWNGHANYYCSSSEQIYF